MLRSTQKLTITVRRLSYTRKKKIIAEGIPLCIESMLDCSSHTLLLKSSQLQRGSVLLEINLFLVLVFHYLFIEHVGTPVESNCLHVLCFLFLCVGSVLPDHQSPQFMHNP